jgi:hypothetical protein
MTVFDLLVPWVLVLGLLYPMRRLERWLHQHIFKVGWLATKSFRRTTIIYYCLFLPGVALNQFIYWLTAGLINVRADSTIAWPETQEIGELQLNFVKLAKNTGQIRVAIISIAPMLIGIALITWIAASILNVSEFVALLELALANAETDLGERLSLAFEHLFAIPDLWLWLYLIFAIANTMFPDAKSLQGWRPILIVLAIVLVLVYALGIGDQIMFSLLGGSLSSVLSVLGLTFAVIIAVDLIWIGILGGIESLIERITGDSATFEKGKLVAVRRADLIKQREQQREKEEKAAKQGIGRAVGTPTVYRLHFPIPTGPTRVPAAQGESPAEETEA